MAQKFIKAQNKNSHSEAYGKYFAQAVYDSHFIGTEELADFIQRQASVKKSDIKAVLQEPEGQARWHRYLQGWILIDRCDEGGGLLCRYDHHPSCTLPARDNPCGSWSEQEGGWFREAEVRERHHAAEGRDLRGDSRQCHERRIRRFIEFRQRVFDWLRHR